MGLGCQCQWHPIKPVVYSSGVISDYYRCKWKSTNKFLQCIVEDPPLVAVKIAVNTQVKKIQTVCNSSDIILQENLFDPSLPPYRFYPDPERVSSDLPSVAFVPACHDDSSRETISVAITDLTEGVGSNLHHGWFALCHSDKNNCLITYKAWHPYLFLVRI